MPKKLRVLTTILALTLVAGLAPASDVLR